MTKTRGDGLAETANRSIAGLILLVMAALLWSLNGAFIKTINKDGSGPSGVTIAFYRSLFAGLFLLPLGAGGLKSIRLRVEGKVESAGWIGKSILSIASFTLMTSCFVIANTKTEAANAIILQYTSTFWVFILSPLVLRESPETRDRWVLAMALTGIGIIFAGNASTDLPGLLIALGAGLFYGLLTLFLRGFRKSDPASVTVMNNLGAAVLLVVPTVVVGELLQPARVIVLLAIMGAVQLGLPYWFFSMALRRVPAHQAAILTMLEPLLVPVWTYLAVREMPTSHTMTGGGVILLALLILVSRGASNRPERRASGREEPANAASFDSITKAEL
jgi:drug/metabolite transporter (DMT)-like permease